MGLRPLPADKVIKNLVGAYNMLMTSSPRVYGLREGVVEAFKRQYLKLWFRWQVLKAVKGMDSMSDLTHSYAHGRDASLEGESWIEGIVRRLPRPAQILVRKALTLLRNPRGVYYKYKSKLVRLFGGVAPIHGEDYDSHWGFTSFKGKVVLDLGADYGSTAHYFLKRGARRVVAVEGDPRLAEELEENFRGDERVVPIHLFIEGAGQVAELIERFDPDLVKVDVEGAEKVLLDLPRELVERREWLVETHSDELYEGLKRFFLECGLGVRAFLYSNELKVIHAHPPRLKPFELKSALRARQCLPRRSSLEGVCWCFKMFCDALQGLALQPCLLKHQSSSAMHNAKRVLRARGRLSRAGQAIISSRRAGRPSR